MVRLTDQEFQEIAAYMRASFGINLSSKRHLIEARLQPVLAQKHIGSFDELFQRARQDSGDMIDLLNRLTTNHTYFMRERSHFDFMVREILPEQERVNASRDLRIWSAGSSSGEEAYTTIMFLTEYFGANARRWDYSMLATDISQKVLEAAENGVYPPASVAEVPPAWLSKYFVSLPGGNVQFRPEYRRLVSFRRFNLMEPIPFHRPFDLIFCRNVMIYFDQPTKTALIRRFYDALKPGGYLFIGHSEALLHSDSRFRYVCPSIYRKG